LDAAFFQSLGGSIKMAEVLGVSTKNLEDDLFNILNGLGGTSLDFGLSLYSLDQEPDRTYRSMEHGLKALALTLKKRLKQGERAVRAVLNDEPALTSVQVDKNRLIEKGGEILLLVGQGALRIGRTIAVQAYEDFSERDFGRPAHDAKSGMLPPKLARMMVNLTGAPKDEALLDPFCGSGTILTEAADLGYRKLVGSDISEKAVSDTKLNMAWIVRERNLQGVNMNVFASDVKDLPMKLPEGAVSVIISEPFLGPPMKGDESDQKIHFMYLELMGLYRRAFNAFAKILKPGGKVVFVFPVFSTGTSGGGKHVNILRELEDYGFRAEGLLPGMAVDKLGARSSTGLVYKRHDQRVGRDIFRFRYNP
jgi:tRNA G10  N-methylase Trm11